MGISTILQIKGFQLLLGPVIAQLEYFTISLHNPNGRQINSFTPGTLKWKFKFVSFHLILVIDGGGIYCVITLRKMSSDLTDDKSTLVQVMAWCRQATSHYLS